MATKAKLIEHSNTAEETREYSLNQAEFLIGRGADCDLRLRESSISRHQCIIRQSGDSYLVVDLGSSNGTFLNDERVRSQATLKTGDKLTIGKFQFLVDLGDPEGIAREIVPGDSLRTTVKIKTPKEGQGKASMAPKKPAKDENAPG